MKTDIFNRIKKSFRTRKLKTLYRYSVKSGCHGGIVIAKNVDDGVNKVLSRYSKFGYSRNHIQVWPVLIDDYYTEEHVDVIDCYGD